MTPPTPVPTATVPRAASRRAIVLSLISSVTTGALWVAGALDLAWVPGSITFYVLLLILNGAIFLSAVALKRAAIPPRIQGALAVVGPATGILGIISAPGAASSFAFFGRSLAQTLLGLTAWVILVTLSGFMGSLFAILVVATSVHPRLGRAA